MRPRLCALVVRPVGLVFILTSLLLNHKPAKADVFVDHDILSVVTTNLIAVFKGPDLYRLTNRLTNEQYLRTPVPFRTSLDMPMMVPVKTQIAGDYWRKGKNDQAAQFMAHDLMRTVTINVVIDPETQDVAVTMWGESREEGATAVTWGVRGLDLTGGHLVLPVEGGRSLEESGPNGELAYHYPGAWEAQMVVWEDKLNSGGFVIYSRDDEYRYKRLVAKHSGPRVDVSFETQAAGPWKSNGSVKAVEWRINCYKGDWKVPALGYRNLMHFSRPPVPLKDGRAWVKDIRTVVSVDTPKPSDALLEALARELQPKRTLLYLPQWRRDGFDPNEADYTARPGYHEFASKAHDMGFHVMVPVPPPGCDPMSSDFRVAQRVLVKDTATGKTAVSPGPSFANYNPAWSRFRGLFIERLKVMMDDLAPDVLFLPGAGTLPNDGNGLFENQTFSQGAVALHRAILTAFPDLLLAGDETNEMISPYSTVTIRSGASPLAPHPISTLLFGNTTFAAAAPPKGVPALQPLDSQGVFPVVRVTSADDIAKPSDEMSLLLKLAKVWQERGVTPDWGQSKGNPLVRWVGDDGAVIRSDKTKDGVTITRGSEVLAQRPATTTKPRVATPQ